MKKLIILILVLATMTGCAGLGGRAAHYPNSVTPEIQAQFNAADELYRSRNFAGADAAFEKFIAGFPYTELTDEARFRRGEMAFLNKNYDTSILYYRQAVSEIVSPKVAPKAHFKTAMSLSKLGRHKEAIGEIELINRKDASAVLKLRADSLGLKSSKAEGMTPNQSIVWHLRLLDDYSIPQTDKPLGIPADELVSEDAALKEARRWVDDTAVTLEELGALPMKEMKGKRSGGFAFYKLAVSLQADGDTRAAVKQLKSYTGMYSKTEYYTSARLLLAELGGSIGESGGTTIGVLLPLSGKYAEYGESTLHGIECAAGIYDPCVGPAGTRLVIRDTESSPTGATGALDDLAADNVMAVVGPLASGNAAEIAARAQELNIPLISLAQREGVAEIGDYIFRNSVSDASEMSTLADYAVKKLHLQRFYIVYSTASKKSSEYRALFAEAVKAAGGTVVATKAYSPTEMAVAVDELRGREAAMAQERDQEAEKEKSVDLLPGTSFDALFVPDSPSAAAHISRMIKGGTSASFRLLGVSRWGDENAISKGGGAMEGSVFVNSFYRGAPDENVRSFVLKFKQAYGIEPTLLEAFGYDAARLIMSAVKEKGAAHRETVRDALARTSGFPGVAGKTTFSAEGDAVRQMWVLTVKDGAIMPAK